MGDKFVSKSKFDIKEFESLSETTDTVKFNPALGIFSVIGIGGGTNKSDYRKTHNRGGNLFKSTEMFTIGGSLPKSGSSSSIDDSSSDYTDTSSSFDDTTDAKPASKPSDNVNDLNNEHFKGLDDSLKNWINNKKAIESHPQPVGHMKLIALPDILETAFEQ